MDAALAGDTDPAEAASKVRKLLTTARDMSVDDDEDRGGNGETADELQAVESRGRVAAPPWLDGDPPYPLQWIDY